MDILADLALRPVFDAGELEKERGVVLEEIAMVEDTPEDLVHDLLSEAQYTGSLRRPILARRRRSAATGATRSGATGRATTPPKTWSWPSPATMTGRRSYRWLSGISRRLRPPPARRGPLPAQAFAPGRLAREKDTEQTHLCLGFPGVPSDSDGLYALSVLSNALGGGMSSRLFQRIREELGLAYSVYTYSSSYQGLGSFCVYAGTTPDNAPTVLGELQSQLDLLLRDGLTDKEFQKRQGAAARRLPAGAGKLRRAHAGAGPRGHLLLGRVRTQEETLSRIEAVTRRP